ncbi:dihydrofolate reductase [Prosthecodimorpha staleyi]|uniref:dihydrofolate reductase n=1 Tax=Prosthecodimorpha staleyi TaxID=2840188 RepID=UPI0021C4766D|nr:dihydrofolate reductase [Prosthecodimorpha staleyi]
MSATHQPDPEPRAPEIALVAAVARNGVIGRDNDLPWRLSSDLRHFRRLTMGRPILMGRRTFQSIGKPLDGRTNIVITRDPAFAVDGVVVAASLEAALRLGREIAIRDGADAVMVTGGGEIYAEAMPHADVLHLTEVDLAPAGTVRFPAIDPLIWQETARVPGERGPRDEAGFAFVTYRRRDRTARAEPA